jgi:hypothetical protein
MKWTNTARALVNTYRPLVAGDTPMLARMAEQSVANLYEDGYRRARLVTANDVRQAVYRITMANTCR